MLRPLWIIPTLLSFMRPSRTVAWSTLSRAHQAMVDGRASQRLRIRTSAFQRYRGGNDSLGGNRPYSSYPSSLKVSLPEGPLSVGSDKPEDPSWHANALALDLPVESFGGLSYWNVQNSKAFRVVFVLGGPGAGKGTQSEFLSENFPVFHLSAGELLRSEQKKEGSPHRALIEDALVSGKIVPVEISLSLLRQAMQEKADTQAGQQCIFLVDGFPRNEDNLAGWCRFMAEPSIADLWGVLVYQCPEKVLEERILERAKLSGRSDDNLESVRKRFKTFKDQTQPIIDELAAISNQLAKEEGATWKVWDISGNQPLPDVTKNTQQMMNQLIRNDILCANHQLLLAIEGVDKEIYRTLCDPLWFEGKDADLVMQEQEGSLRGAAIGEISDARMEFVSGKHVSVSYTRQIEGQPFRETRVWVHKGIKGWQNVHFVRTPSA